MMQSNEERDANQARQDYFRRFGGTAPENYERFFVSSIGAPLASGLVDAAVLRPDERVLDVACGTGVVARAAKARVGSGAVAGLDVNPGMLAVARAVTSAGLSIEWHHASAEAMPLADDSFDVVLCQLGLQFFGDKIAALREMRRVLAPGGRLVLSTVGPTPAVFQALAEGLGRHIGPQARRFIEMVFSMHDVAEVERALAEAGLREIFIAPRTTSLRLPAPADFLWEYISSTPLSAPLAQASEERRAALERDVTAAWSAFVDSGSLVCPLRVLIAAARK